VNDAVLHAIRTRRVVRALTDAPVGHDQLRTVLDSARYAPHAGNRRLHRYVVATQPSLLRAVRMVSPGMLQSPMAAIVVCVDWAQVHNYGFSPANPGPYIDVGTAAATLLLAAHRAGGRPGHLLQPHGPRRDSQAARWGASRVDHLSRPRGHRTATRHATPGRTQVGRPHPVGARLNPPRYPPPPARERAAGRRPS
jgi:hypothetical protein